MNPNGLRRVQLGHAGYGIPLQVLSDNDWVFTGRLAQPPVEVLFDCICRANGVDHILTESRSRDASEAQCG